MGELRRVSLVYRGGPAGSQAYTGTIGDLAYKGNLKQMTDIVTPGYKVLSKQGVTINNPCSRIVTRHEPYMAVEYSRAAPSGAWEVINGPTVSFICGRVENNLPIHQIPITQLAQIATLEAWNRVEPAKSQSLVTALEAHKTWDTIYDRTKKLAKVVEACRRLDVRALRNLMPGAVRKPVPKRYVVWDTDGRPLLERRGRVRSVSVAPRVSSNPGVLDEASKLWLEYRYGWTPLVYDITDSLKAIYAADLRSELLPRDILIARGREKAKDENQYTAIKTAGGLQYYTKYAAVYEFEVRTFIRYRWSAPQGILRRLNDFGLFDVPRALWEIVPFSFVADWIIPIGDWLGALTPKIGVEYLNMGHAASFKTSGYQEIYGVPAVNPPNAAPADRWQPACPLGSRDTYESQTYDRQTYLGTPYFPPIDVKINIKRMADAAALFRRMR